MKKNKKAFTNQTSNLIYQIPIPINIISYYAYDIIKRGGVARQGVKIIIT